jgi:hypothetical protein
VPLYASLYDFFNECCEKRADKLLYKGDFNRFYEAWCEIRHKRPLNRHERVTGLLLMGFEECSTRKARGTDNPERCWAGFGLTESARAAYGKRAAAKTNKEPRPLCQHD